MTIDDRLSHSRDDHDNVLQIKLAKLPLHISSSENGSVYGCLRIFFGRPGTRHLTEHDIPMILLEI